MGFGAGLVVVRVGLSDRVSRGFRDLGKSCLSACDNPRGRLDRVSGRREATLTPPRAGKDAERLANGILRGLKVMREGEPSTAPDPV